MKIAGFHNQFRFLSNFWPSEITVCGVRFPTVEHAYQAMKSPHRENWIVVADLKRPGQAKRTGQRLTIRSNWERIKIPVMRMLLRKKFYWNPELEDALLLTEPYYLEETNDWGDTFWGVCDGVGENHLGKLLMQVRDELRIDYDPET